MLRRKRAREPLFYTVRSRGGLRCGKVDKIVSKSGVAALVYEALGEVAVHISILACFCPRVL